MMAVPNNVGIQPLCRSRINPFIPNSSYFRCKNSHHNSVSLHHPTTISVADRVLMDIHNSGIIACLRAQRSVFSTGHAILDFFCTFDSPPISPLKLDSGRCFNHCTHAELAVEAARAALRGGVSVLEITMSTPGVFEALQCLVQEYPSASIGVGTILDRRNAKDAVNLGAKFLLSPAMVKGVLNDVAEGQALYIPGATTPTEILSASGDGAKIIKVYPVSALGGVEYLSAVKKPFPHIPMVASQGMTLDSVGLYIGVGASAVVLSDAIFDKNALARGDFDLIYQLASSATIKGNLAVSKAHETRV